MDDLCHRNKGLNLEFNEYLVTQRFFSALSKEQLDECYIAIENDFSRKLDVHYELVFEARQLMRGGI